MPLNVFNNPRTDAGKAEHKNVIKSSFFSAFLMLIIYGLLLSLIKNSGASENQQMMANIMIATILTGLISYLSGKDTIISMEENLSSENASLLSLQSTQ